MGPRSPPLMSAANAPLMFPTLTAAQIARIASHGVTRPVTRGDAESS
jgi:thioredoxin reductase (NADPH)